MTQTGHFSVDLQPAAPPMVHETSVFSTKVSKTKSLRTLSVPRHILVPLYAVAIDFHISLLICKETSIFWYDFGIFWHLCTKKLQENKLDEEVPPDRDDLPPDWPMHTESVGIFGAMPPAEVLEKILGTKWSGLYNYDLSIALLGFV